MGGYGGRCGRGLPLPSHGSESSTPGKFGQNPPFTAAALLSEICRNRRFLKGWVILSMLGMGAARNPSMDR